VVLRNIAGDLWPGRCILCRLYLRLKNEFLCAQLGVQFRYDGRSLFVSRGILASTSSSFLRLLDALLQLLFLLREGEFPGSECCTRDSQSTLGGIRSWPAPDLDFEVAQYVASTRSGSGSCRAIGGGGGTFRGGVSLLLLLVLTIGLAFSFITSLSLLVKSIKTFATES